MKAKIFILLVILLVLSSASPRSRRPRPRPTPQPSDDSNDFTDFSVLSLTWLPKFCDKPTPICVSKMYQNWVKNGANYFTIHGYWPGGPNFKDCMPQLTYDSLKQNIEKDSQLKQDLINYWPDSKKKQDFWQHQWQTHGQCYAYLNREIINDPNQIFKTYFKETVKKYKALNLPAQEATNQQIFNSKKQLSEKVLNNLDSKFFYPICKGRNQISEIRVCYTYGAPGEQQFYECPQNDHQICRQYPVILLGSGVQIENGEPQARFVQTIRMAAANSTSSIDQKYEVLALTWLPEFCNGVDCLQKFKRVQQFTIHGFWPQGRQFKDCHDAPLYKQYKSLLGNNLLSNMQSLWPNSKVPKGRNPFNIWQHEWTKHGSCYFQVHAESGMHPTQIFTSYFEQTIKRYNNLGIQGIRGRSFDNINILADVLGLKTSEFYPKCRQNSNFISQIIVCYSQAYPGTQTIIDCPPTNNPQEIDDRISCPLESTLRLRSVGRRSAGAQN